MSSLVSVDSRTKGEQAEGWHQRARLHFHHCAKISAKVKAQVTQEKSSSWTFIPRQESKREKEEPEEPRTVLPGSWTSVPRKPEEKVPPSEVRFVLPRGSMIKENLTRVAALGPSPQGPQTATPTTTRQKHHFSMDLGSLQQWRSIQEACRIELQTLQAPHQSDYRTYLLHDRIKSFTLDMDAFNQSCSAEAAVGFEQVGSREPSAKDKKLAHPAPQSKLTKKRQASPLAFSSGSHRHILRHRVRQAPMVKQKHRYARKRTRRYRRRPRRTKISLLRRSRCAEEALPFLQRVSGDCSIRDRFAGRKRSCSLKLINRGERELAP